MSRDTTSSILLTFSSAGSSIARLEFREPCQFAFTTDSFLGNTQTPTASIRFEVKNFAGLLAQPQ